MKIKYHFVAFFFIISIFSFSTNIYAHDNEEERRDQNRNHSERENGKTLVLGTVRNSEGERVGGEHGDVVAVTCNGNTKSQKLKHNGEYTFKFLQSQCKEGHVVTVSATTSVGSGTSTGKVQDGWRRIDFAIINITVPELGLVTGTISAIGAAGGYLLLQRRI